MAVLGVVPNLPARDPAHLAAFHQAVFGTRLDHVMGWIACPGAAGPARPRLQLAWQRGSGTDRPALSIPVDDLDEALTRLRLTGAEPACGPVTEPRGIRRVHLRDPDGNLVNVAQHAD